jgi:long-chain acyl-CoA synthetase
MVKLVSVSTERAMELRDPPEAGKPYSVPVPGSAQPGRSAVYRNWRFPNELMETLDPKIRTCHEFFEETC